MTSLAAPLQRRLTTPLEDASKLGDVLARSGYFSDARDAAQAAVKVLAGAELGFGPIASMTGIYIVKGNVTISANLMATVIDNHPDYAYRIKALNAERCEIVFFKRDVELGTSSFTMDDARTAGLANKDNWRQYPRNMLFARAMSNGAAWLVPGAFAGPIYTPDELGVDSDPETGRVIDGTGSAALIPGDAPPVPPPSATSPDNGSKGEAAVPGLAPGSTTPTSSAGALPDLEPDPAKMSAAAPLTSADEASDGEPVPAEDPSTPISERQAEILRELMRASNAPEAQQRMWLLAAGVSLRASEDPLTTAGRLTVGQARLVMDDAQKWVVRA